MGAPAVPPHKCIIRQLHFMFYPKKPLYNNEAGSVIYVSGRRILVYLYQNIQFDLILTQYHYLWNGVLSLFLGRFSVKCSIQLISVLLSS